MAHPADLRCGVVRLTRPVHHFCKIIIRARHDKLCTSYSLYIQTRLSQADFVWQVFLRYV